MNHAWMQRIQHALKWAICYAIMAGIIGVAVFYYGALFHSVTGSWVPIVVVVAIAVTARIVRIPTIDRVLSDALSAIIRRWNFDPEHPPLGFLYRWYLIAKSARMPVWGALLLALATAWLAVAITHQPVAQQNNVRFCEADSRGRRTICLKSYVSGPCP